MPAEFWGWLHRKQPALWMYVVSDLWIWDFRKAFPFGLYPLYRYMCTFREYLEYTAMGTVSFHISFIFWHGVFVWSSSRTFRANAPRHRYVFVFKIRHCCEFTQSGLSPSLPILVLHRAVPHLQHVWEGGDMRTFCFCVAFICCQTFISVQSDGHLCVIIQER